MYNMCEVGVSTTYQIVLCLFIKVGKQVITILVVEYYYNHSRKNIFL